jgi:hypothetical protein
VNHKQSVLIFLAVSLGGLLLVAGVNAVVDPYHILHRPYWGQARFSINTRFQNAGLINSYLDADLGFDSVIIGTSLDECYNLARMQQKLGTAKVLNLAVESSTPQERSVVLERALSTGKVRRVLWGVYENYADTVPDRENAVYPFPFDLYQKPLSRVGLGGVIHHLLNASVLKESLALVTGRTRWSTDLSTAYDWTPLQIKSGGFARFSAPENLPGLAETVAQGKPSIAQARRELGRAGSLEFPALEKHLAQVVLRHPDVRFDLVFSPVSAVYFHTLGSEALLRQMGLRLRLVRTLAGAANVRIFGFDDDFEVTGNVTNYLDYYHVLYRANDRVVDAIAADRHRLTPETVEGYVTRLLDHLQAYQVYADREHSLWAAGNETKATP